MTKAERTRQFIIEQSAPVFNTKGVAGTAMSDVMQVTKMAKGGLYGHFESKEELSCAVVDYCLKTMSDSISSGLNRKKTAREKLFYFIDHFARVDKPIIEGGCPMLNFGSEADDTNPAIKERVNKGIKDSQALLSSILACGQANNEFKSDWQIEDFAVKMFAMLEGGMLMAKVADDNMAMKKISKMLKDEITAHTI
ncbi:TetR family transcriptional regulator [Mucilaginibacter achroorhodeus]|uniref:TetR family transcriptional regulator n=1 Tax=Mucilaginibacter achroorhodeus TaxID=2599294 RepID=A0A563U9V7_9SPHI|nr:TetR family transcriptional regulator [Mucilaginibacter achroorhodeus]TWR28059.1 TetR family transcriptional regulator [Mucilaginibacter achroorhodeus]